MFDAADWDDYPVWTIVQFVADFVDGFVEKIGFEKNLEVVEILGNERGVSRCIQVVLEELAAHQSIPDVGPTFEKRNIFGAHRRLPQRAVSGVLKRAHHPGDVTQRRTL